MVPEGHDAPSVGRSYEVDQRACKVFRSWLPDFWLPREQFPDLFIDFLVETVEQGEPTGVHFGVQVKGTSQSSPRTSLRYRFKSKHLQYYLARCPHPVFFFLINVATGKGWWLFAQKYIREQLRPDRLDQQKSATVRFNVEDSLDNMERFKDALAEAVSYVKDLHPGSLHAALQKHKAELEAKDPRVSVSLSVEDGKQTITMFPKEPFAFTTEIRSRDPGFKDAFRDFIERGRDLKLKSGDFQIVGAPLLEELTKSGSGELTFRLGVEHTACCQIFVGEKDQRNVLQVDGRIRGGAKFAVFAGGFRDSPLMVTWELALAPDCHGKDNWSIVSAVGQKGPGRVESGPFWMIQDSPP